jgi:Fe2+ or Zn2+ uptake regulation protein
MTCININTMENYEKLLTQTHYKLTKPRKQILKTLFQTKKPLSATQIKQKNQNINLASIYRNLKLLTSLNIIFNETINSELFYYLDKKPHHHIICKICGRTECLPCTHVFHLKNFKNISHQLILTGICNHCN